MLVFDLGSSVFGLRRITLQAMYHFPFSISHFLLSGTDHDRP